MLKTLRLITIFTSIFLLPVLARAEGGLIDVQQEYNTFKADFAADPTALMDGLQAYDCGVASGDAGRPGILTIVDYSLPSYDKRLWVLDLATHKVLYNTYVAHGAGSGKVDATYFSNHNNSDASSIGLYETANSYSGEWGYSLRLDGLEKYYNNNAYRRGIVMHGGNYVSSRSVSKYGMIGMSDGCLAVPTRLDNAIINTIKNGSLIFAYYPKYFWLQDSHFLHCSVLKRYNA